MVSPLLADLFESHRGQLLSVAYRLTGSVGDAEEAVQESWLRMAGVHQSEIDDLRAWLVGAVARICLDHLRGAAVRRETYAGRWLPEPVVTSPATRTAAEFAALAADPRHRLAALVAMDALAPAERLALVLRDGTLPDAEIAALLEVDVAEVGALAERAARTLGRVPAPVGADEHAAVVRAFLAALTAGDANALVARIHPEPACALAPPALAAAALSQWHDYLRDAVLELSEADVNGRLGLVLTDPNSPFGRPVRVVGFTVHEERIWGVYDFADMHRMAGARLR
ncbi:sigma factor [Nocardia thailandica]|uniref:Sigma factor n=1 Tax=Nocardia thailandica TaxID=257275 RepID=A0ABW6PJ25_9NOCA|nr:sigma factor [Nocardia thailandica]